jgi:gliding motility-associated-like protein
MKKKYLNIILVLFGLYSYNAYSQVKCTVPLPPVLTSVSVHPETGNTEFTWSLSPDTAIAAYVLYTFKDGTGMSFDTVWNPAATSYSYNNSATKYFSVSHVIAAHRMPDCTSPLSNVLNTIYCSSEIDTCNKEIIINWNSYPDYPKSVTGYKIFVSINGSPFSEMYSVDKMTKTYSISDFTSDFQYCFIVKALLDDGTLSGSNKSCLSTKMQRPPQWINADYATVNTANEISLSYTIDPLSEIEHFSLERKSGVTGTFQEIAQPVSENGSVVFIDNQADVNIINYYRLSAINNCNIPATVSNLSSNMVLTLDWSGNDLNLSWSSYREWMGIISSYQIFINTGKGFEEKKQLEQDDTLFKLAYQEIMYEVTSNEVCFYVRASETSNPYGITGQSHSSVICTVPTEIITVPNVFTPGSGTLNAYFRPVLSFTPGDYHLVISDRQGKILFETRDYYAKWDGTKNGNPQPQGVSLWFLKVTTPSGKSISKTGTITIIKSR